MNITYLKIYDMKLIDGSLNRRYYARIDDKYNVMYETDGFINKHLSEEQFINYIIKNGLVLRSEQLPKNNCTLNRYTCGKGSGCKYPHCHI